MLTYFLYTDIPGAGRGWTVAILAVGRRDADAHRKAVWKGGKFLRKVEWGKVLADCGDVTEAASKILNQKF